MKKDFFIKELLNTKKLHQDFSRNICRKKSFVIRFLKAKKTGPLARQKVINYLEEWRGSHEGWITLVRKHPQMKSYGGTIAWQKRWIKFYNQLLKFLKTKKPKKGGK